MRRSEKRIGPPMIQSLFPWTSPSLRSTQADLFRNECDLFPCWRRVSADRRIGPPKFHPVWMVRSVTAAESLIL